jgi:hypothetical protein
VLYKAVIKGLPDEPALVRPGANWVDVLDLAEAHSLALEKPAAGGHRFIITAGPHVLQEFGWCYIHIILPYDLSANMLQSTSPTPSTSSQQESSRAKYLKASCQLLS